MHTGVIRSRYRKSDLDQAIKEYREKALPALAAHKGNRSGTLLVNRETGDVLSIGFYEDEASARAFAPNATALLESFKKFQSEPAEPKRELFEIAASTQQEAKALVAKGFNAFTRTTSKRSRATLRRISWPLIRTSGRSRARRP